MSAYRILSMRTTFGTAIVVHILQNAVRGFNALLWSRKDLLKVMVLYHKYHILFITNSTCARNRIM